MTRVHSLLTGMSTLAMVAALSAPGFAAKAVIADEDLDQVTAAGEPKIAMVSDTKAQGGDVYANNEQYNWFEGVLKEGSQHELKAITLNNVFGENQVANGVNIQSATGFAEDSGQKNKILQSWGSAKATAGKKVDGVASHGDNISAIAQANAQAQVGNKIVASDIENKQEAEVNQTIKHSAKAGRLSVLWAFADEIASVEGSKGRNAYATNYVDTNITGVIEGGAQSNISALTVNNVFGMNQLANALNVASGDVGFSPLALTAASGSSSANQSNTIQQYRGAPAGWTDAPVFSK